jgi:hypothetical protein
VDPAAVLATKGGSAFLDGKEFNDFLREAFLSIRVSAKRGHDLEEIRGRLARTLARHKLLGGLAARKELALQDIRVETAIQKYIDENSLSENLDLKAADMESFPAVKMQAEKQFIHDPASGVDAMRKAWSAKTPQAPSRYLRILGGAAEEDLERRLNAGLGKDEVFGWMQARDFPGSFHEAKEILAKEKLEKELGDMLTRNGIEFPQVRKSKP